MVNRILEERSSMKEVLDYNYEKVHNGVACILAFHGFKDVDEHSVRDRFTWFENANYSSGCVSFHMAINPNDKVASEALTNREANEYAMELMKALGLDGQPWILFKHEDIARAHYHVVSIRIKEDGRRISSYKERVKLKRRGLELQEKFHNILGDETKHLMQKHGGAYHKLERYNPEIGELSEQFRIAFETAVSYKFKSFPQFAALMADSGYRVELYAAGTPKLAYQGMNQNGTAATHLVKDARACREYAHILEDTMEKNGARFSQELTSAASLKYMMSRCLEYSKNEHHFRALMAKKGVGVHFSKGADGRIRGVIVIDHNTKNVFNGSEIGRKFTASKFQSLIDDGTWTPLKRETRQMRYMVPLNGIGVGVSPVQHDDKDAITKDEYRPYVGSDILKQTLNGIRARVSNSHGKDPKKKEKKKPRKAKYL